MTDDKLILDDHLSAQLPPGVDEVLELYESVEEIYRAAIEASSVYTDNGITTSNANQPPPL